MAFRTETRTGCLMLAMLLPVIHVHLRRDEPGDLKITETGIEYTETKQHKKPHHWTWTWTDIQRLTLFPNRVEIVAWKGNHEFNFKGKNAESMYPLLRDKLPRRFIPEVAATGFTPTARLLAVRSGHEGELLIGEDRIVFQSATSEGSHTWILPEIDNISTSDPLDFTIHSLGVDYRLQLKQPLPEDLYNGLWRKLNVRRKSS